MKNSIFQKGDYKYYLFPEDLEWGYENIHTKVLERVHRKNGFTYLGNGDPLDYILIIMSLRCNTRCDYCFRGFHDSKQEVPFENIKKVIDHFKSAKTGNVKTVHLTGGEIFIRKDIVECLRYFKDQDFRIWINTNGISSKISSIKEIADIFTADRHKHMRISLDGHLPEIHEKYRQKGTFRKIVANIRYLVGRGVKLSVKTVLTDHNFIYMEELMEFLYELQIDGWNYNALRFTGEMISNEQNKKIGYVSYSEIANKITSILLRKPYLSQLNTYTRYGKIIDTLYAPVPKKINNLQYSLFPDGNVYLGDNMCTSMYMTGNIYKDGMNAFSKLEEYRKQYDYELNACLKCPINGFCIQKGDYGELFNKTNKLDQEFPNCEDLRQMFYHILTLREAGEEIYRNMFPVYEKVQA